MFQRDERIVALLHEELSALVRSIKDPGISGLATLTSVELSRDRKTARIYFSVLGGAEDCESTTRALERAADYLRFRLKGALRLKVIPRLEFRYDDTPERAQRIEGILGRIEDERRGG